MLNVKPIRQKPGECGPVSLEMVLRYFGLEADNDELVNITGCTPDKGIPAKMIIKAARKFGMKAIIKDNSNFEDIRNWVINKKVPVIVDWFSDDDGHYAVVVDINKNNIYLQDPELGHIRAMKLDHFYRIWFDFNGNYMKSKNDLIIRRMIIVYPKSLTNYK